MSTSPFFTIAIPTYNRGAILSKAITSALGQTDGDFELLISDNGSTDNTHSIVQSFADPRVVSVRHLTNGGMFFNFHYCMLEARGRYLVFLSDDDFLAPNFLENSRRAVDSHPGIGLIYSGRQCLDVSNGTICLAAEGAEVFYPDLASWLKRVREATIVNISGVVLNCNYLKPYLPFDDWGAGWGIDDYLFMMMVAHGGAFGFKSISVSMSIGVRDNNVMNTEPSLVLSSSREVSKKMFSLVDTHVPLNQQGAAKQAIRKRYNDSVFVPRFLVKHIVRKDGSFFSLLMDFREQRIAFWQLFKSTKTLAGAVFLMLPKAVRFWVVNRFTNYSAPKV